jgi:hypothetical protein
MENINLKDRDQYNRILELLLSSDNENRNLAFTILDQSDYLKYKNQIKSLFKIAKINADLDKYNFSKDFTEKILFTNNRWQNILLDETENGNEDSVQMLADIFADELQNTLFSSDGYKILPIEKFKLKLIYNG